MTTPAGRIAVNNLGGYIPGLNAVLLGVVRAAAQLGREVVGIRDGFDGLLFPDRYPHGGVVSLSPEVTDRLLASDAPLLGTAGRTDPFRVRTINKENQVEEVDRSGDLLAAIHAQNISAIVSVAGMERLSQLLKLHRRGAKIVCVPASVENDVSATQLSFGFNTTLSCAVDMIERARQAAQSSRKTGVVEILGRHTGWLALQAGIAAGADAVLIPEIPYDIHKLAEALQRRQSSDKHCGLVVVAEGAEPLTSRSAAAVIGEAHPLKASLAPLASGGESAHAIDRSGLAAKTIANELQRLTGEETYPIVLGQLIKSGTPTAVDRQLGLGYGAAAVRAVKDDKTGVMVAFEPPQLKYVPLPETINKIRVVPPDSLFLQTARSLGICLGERGNE